MEFLKKYPKTFQWLFLLIVFFALCFAIDVPETYKFIRGQAEFVKDPNQSSYVFLGKEVRYYAFDVFWRLPPLLGWLPIWINDSLFFLMNEWMPIEVWNEDTQEFKSRPIVLQISRNLTAFMTFLIQLFLSLTAFITMLDHMSDIKKENRFLLQMNLLFILMLNLLEKYITKEKWLLYKE